MVELWETHIMIDLCTVMLQLHCCDVDHAVAEQNYVLINQGTIYRQLKQGNLRNHADTYRIIR